MSQPEFDSVALELITEFGTTGTYTSVTTGLYSPSTGTVASTPVSQPMKVLLMDLTRPANGLSTKYGTEILAGDKECYAIPPVKTGGTSLTVDPVNDKLVVAGVTYTIVVFKEVNPSGVDPILYSFYLRR